jgi:tetratricopeptide (TPR) repeat protein
MARGVTSTPARKEAAARLFQVVLAKPALFGIRVKREARFRLAWLRMERGEHEAAAELLRENLTARVPLAVEANTRQRLAEALEGAGQVEAAEAERRRVGELLTGAKDDAERLLSEAKMLNSQQRFAEAYAALERGLAQIPEANSAARAKTMVQLANTAFNAGKPEETIRWGEMALQLKPSYTFHHLAHSVLGLKRV